MKVIDMQTENGFENRMQRIINELTTDAQILIENGDLIAASKLQRAAEHIKSGVENIQSTSDYMKDYPNEIYSLD